MHLLIFLAFSWEHCSVLHREGLTKQAWAGYPQTCLIARRVLGWHLTTWILERLLLFPEWFPGLNCTNNAVYADYLLSVWESGVWGYIRPNMPTRKTLGTEPLRSFPIDSISQYCQFAAGRIKPVLCDSTWERTLEAWAWFPPDSAACIFPLLVLLCIFSL